MQSVLYVSPSTIPSRTANSIHVINQVNALAEIGHPVTLICASYAAGSLKDHISEFYGLKLCDRVTVDAFKFAGHERLTYKSHCMPFLERYFNIVKAKQYLEIYTFLYFHVFSAITKFLKLMV